MVEQDHAIGNIFLQPMSSESTLTALGGDDGGYTLVFESAKQAAQFRAQNALILQSSKQIFDGVQDYTASANGVDGGAQPYEKALQIYRRRKRRILGDEFTSTHFRHGHLKTLSFGKTMCPHRSQICRPLERTFIGLNPASKTQ